MATVDCVLALSQSTFIPTYAVRIGICINSANQFSIESRHCLLLVNVMDDDYCEVSQETYKYRKNLRLVLITSRCAEPSFAKSSPNPVRKLFIFFHFKFLMNSRYCISSIVHSNLSFACALYDENIPTVRR